MALTSDEIRGIIAKLANELPELAWISLNREQEEEWVNEILAELKASSESPENVISLILRMQAFRHKLDISRRISVIVPGELKDSRVMIFDWQQPNQADDRTYPRAVILRPDHNQGSMYVPVESIDIIRSVD